MPWHPKKSGEAKGAPVGKAGGQGAPLKDQNDPLVLTARDAIKRSGEASWVVADAFLEMSKRPGWKQTRIAAACGVHQGTVSRLISCAKRYALAHKRPPFWEAYRVVGGHGGAKGKGKGGRRKGPSFPVRLPPGDLAKFKEWVKWLKEYWKSDTESEAVATAVQATFECLSKVAGQGGTAND
jgi:hypothetical protein